MKKCFCFRKCKRKKWNIKIFFEDIGRVVGAHLVCVPQKQNTFRKHNMCAVNTICVPSMYDKKKGAYTRYAPTLYHTIKRRGLWADDKADTEIPGIIPMIIAVVPVPVRVVATRDTAIGGGSTATTAAQDVVGALWSSNLWIVAARNCLEYACRAKANNGIKCFWYSFSDQMSWAKYWA